MPLILISRESYQKSNSQSRKNRLTRNSEAVLHPCLGPYFSWQYYSAAWMDTTREKILQMSPSPIRGLKTVRNHQGRPNTRKSKVGGSPNPHSEVRVKQAQKRRVLTASFIPHLVSADLGVACTKMTPLRRLGDAI